MRAADICALYDYHYWANGRIITALAQVEHARFVAPAAVQWGSLRGTLVHLLWSEVNWLARWEGRPTVPRFTEEAFPTKRRSARGLGDQRGDAARLPRYPR